MLMDTHQVVEDIIKSGLKKNQAEIITRAINQSNNDLVIKADLKSAVERLELKIDLEFKWMKILMLAILGLLIKLTFF